MFEALRVHVVAADRSVDGGWASRSSRDHAAGRKTRGVVLADLTWPQAEAILTVDAVVVTPLGAAAKEHGPHLRLDNDLRLAQYLAARVVEKGATGLNPRGELYDEDNVRERLSVRDFMTELRDAGVVTGGPAPFGTKDKQRFANALDRELTRLLR